MASGTELSAQDVANRLWGLGTVVVHRSATWNSGVSDALAGVVLEVLPEASSQEFANLL